MTDMTDPGEVYAGDMRYVTGFTITPDHLLLLRNMQVGWSWGEYGAPCISPKRPYGNSDVPADIARILGWQRDDDGLPERAARIHAEMGVVLQIVLTTLSFRAGRYTRRNPYMHQWKEFT